MKNEKKDLFPNPDKEKPFLSKTIAIVAVVFSGIASWLIANIGADYDRQELGALITVFAPAIIAAIVLLVFLLADWLFPKGRIWFMVIFVVINILYGMHIRYISS